MTIRRVCAGLLCALAPLGAGPPARAGMVCVTITASGGPGGEVTTGPWCSADTPFTTTYHEVHTGPDALRVTVEYVTP